MKIPKLPEPMMIAYEKKQIQRKQTEMRELLDQVKELQDKGKHYQALRPLAKAWKLDRELKKEIKELERWQSMK